MVLAFASFEFTEEFGDENSMAREIIMNGACFTADHSKNSCTSGRVRHACASTATVVEESGPRPLPVPSAIVQKPCTEWLDDRDGNASLEGRDGDRARATG